MNSHNFSSSSANSAFQYATRLCKEGRFHEAKATCALILNAFPNNAHTLYLLGCILQQLNEYDKSIHYISRAIEQLPGIAMMHNNLGKALSACRHKLEACRQFKIAVEIDPNYDAALIRLFDQKKQLCDWDGIGELSQNVISRVEQDSCNISPFLFLSIDSSPQQQLRCASQYAKGHYNHIKSIRSGIERTPCEAAGKEKIHVGYLSSDFRAHATTYLISELFELHNREHFRIFAYSTGVNDNSAARARIIQGVDQFHDLECASTLDAAKKIRDDRIDILIDLKGYTGGGRPEILAMRPAPIQVSFLGYPGTTGAKFIDYIIADRYVVKPDQVNSYSETLIFMPNCYQVNDRGRPISNTNLSRADCNLPEQSVVFCCFNSCYKITPQIFDSWMRILKKVDNSVLWLLEEDPHTIKNLKAEANKRGVDPEILIFAPRKSLGDHLERYKLADLFLDTHPVNAHTTASDALWVGCPVVTYSGETYASRVAGSLLTTVGLNELITYDFSTYEQKAIELGKDANKLEKLKLQLKNCRHINPLFDTTTYTKQLESAYKRICLWKRNFPTSQME